MCYNKAATVAITIQELTGQLDQCSQCLLKWYDDDKLGLAKMQRDQALKVQGWLIQGLPI